MGSRVLCCLGMSWHTYAMTTTHIYTVYFRIITPGSMSGDTHDMEHVDQADPADLHALRHAIATRMDVPPMYVDLYNVHDNIIRKWIPPLRHIGTGYAGAIACKGCAWDQGAYDRDRDVMKARSTGGTRR